MDDFFDAVAIDERPYGCDFTDSVSRDFTSKNLSFTLNSHMCPRAFSTKIVLINILNYKLLDSSFFLATN